MEAATKEAVSGWRLAVSSERTIREVALGSDADLSHFPVTLSTDTHRCFSIRHDPLTANR
jgi:hypothetical protein